MKKEKQHLPRYGVGPIYCLIIAALTIAAFLCRNVTVVRFGKLETLGIPFMVIGIVFIILGVFMWVQALVVSKIGDGIMNNHLVTSGIYAWVRNPIYSAVMVTCTGVIFIIGNALFFILPIVYWFMMTVLMKLTEEKWLRSLYGKEYDDYCKKVNRCIPWFPKK